MVTVISPDLKRTSERIDTHGNIINAKTKELIQKNDQEYIPTPEEMHPVINGVSLPTESPTTLQVSIRNPKIIQEDIVVTEAKLEQLKEEKRMKIEEMRRELEELES